MEDRGMGEPRTEEERQERHRERYGQSGLPPRGTGLTGQELLERAAELTIQALDESMRADDEIQMVAAGTTDDLKFEVVKPGRLMILEHLSGYDDTSSPTRIRVGYWNGHRLNWLRTIPAPIISETVEHNGRILLREGMYPIVRFETAVAGDDLYAALNGYWIKTK
ncbi:MAG: hypothetical protein KAT75_00630 [Dehalococcoidia bacterium]|nr:hypothetical protein [Dehalococcoidia bacterium]